MVQLYGADDGQEREMVVRAHEISRTQLNRRRVRRNLGRSDVARRFRDEFDAEYLESAASVQVAAVDRQLYAVQPRLERQGSRRFVSFSLGSDLSEMLHNSHTARNEQGMWNFVISYFLFSWKNTVPPNWSRKEAQSLLYHSAM